MPAAPKTSTAAILDSAGWILEQSGADAVTMHAVARAVGIRAPSLYRHFPDRAALLEALALEGFTLLSARMQAAARAEQPLTAMAHAYRAFAHNSPQRYLHMLSRQTSMRDSLDAARAGAASPLLGYLDSRVGAERALSMARLLTAFAHGFVSMELNGAFRLGGNPEADFDEGVRVLQETVVLGARSLRRGAERQATERRATERRAT